MDIVRQLYSYSRRWKVIKSYFLGINASIMFVSSIVICCIEEVNARPSNSYGQHINTSLSNSKYSDIQKAITSSTVKIIGPVNGTGVITLSQNNLYTVLTSWHVVRSIGENDEIYMQTFDGKKHKAIPNSIKQVGKVDLATLTFESTFRYKPSKMAADDVSSGDIIYVGGYPDLSDKISLEKGFLSHGKWRSEGSGSSSLSLVDLGYGLMYTNTTSRGMSGGGLFNANGVLVGIHGRGQLDMAQSIEVNQKTKSGMNYGIPIELFLKKSDAEGQVLSQLSLTEDFFEDLSSLLFYEIGRGFERIFLDLVDSSPLFSDTYQGHYLKAKAYIGIGDYPNALASLDKALSAKNLTKVMSSAALLMRSSIFMNQREYLYAIKDLRVVSTDQVSNYNYVRSSLMLSECYWLLGDKDQSQKEWINVEKIRLSGALMPLTIATIYDHTARNHNIYGKYQDAIDVSRLALNYPISPGYERSFRRRMAYAFQRLGKLDDALYMYNKLVSELPFDFVARESIGFILLSQGKTQLAEEQARLMIDIEPRNPLGHNLYAFIYKDNGDTLQACKSIERAYYLHGGNMNPKHAAHQWFINNCEKK